MSESLPEIPSIGAEHRHVGLLIDGDVTAAAAASSPSSSISSMAPHVTTSSSLSSNHHHQPPPPLYPIVDTSSNHSLMDEEEDGSYGQQEKSPPELLEAIGNSSNSSDVLDPSNVGVTSSDDGENPMFMSMMGAAMAAAQLQSMNQQIQWQQYMLLQQQQALIAHAQMKRTNGGGGTASVMSPPRPPPLSGEVASTVEPQMPSPVGSAQHSSPAAAASGGGGMSGQLTAALLSAGVHSPGSSSPSVANSDDTKTMDLGVTTPKAGTSPGTSVVGSNVAESDVGTLPLVAITEDCSLDAVDNGDDIGKCNEFTLEVSPDTQGPAGGIGTMGGADGNMQGMDTQTWQQFQQLQYNQWSYAAAMNSNPWYYGGGYPGTRGYGQGGEMMRPDGMRSSSSAAAAEAVAGIKRRKKPYAAPKGVWRNNGGYNATIYVNKKRIYGPVRRNLADAVSDRRVMEDSVDSARAKVERMIEEQHKTFESDQARESFIAEESHTMIREVVAKLRAERGTHNSASGPADPRPSVQNSMSSQQSRRPGVVPSLAQAVYGTARPGNMMSMPFMMPYPSTMWPRPMASASRSPPLPRPSRKRDRSVAKEEVAKSDVKLDSTKLADSVLFGGGSQGTLSTTDIEIAADPPLNGDGGDSGDTSAVTPSDAKRARTLPTTSTSTTASSYVPLSPLFNPGSPPLSSRMFSSALPKYLRSPAFPATQITPSRMPSFGPNNGNGHIMDDDIQLEESAIGVSSSAGGVDGSVYGKAIPSFGYALSPTFMPYQTTMSSTTTVSYPPTTSAAAPVPVAATSTGTSASSASSSTTAATTPTANNNISAACLTFANSPGLQPSSAASFWTPHLQYLKHSPAFASQSSSASAAES